MTKLTQNFELFYIVQEENARLANIEIVVVTLQACKRWKTRKNSMKTNIRLKQMNDKKIKIRPPVKII